MRIVVALGGNALLERGEAAGAAAQHENVHLAATVLARIAEEHELVITHRSGYLLGLAIRNELPDRELVTVLTQVVVDADDPALPMPEPRAIVELRTLRRLICDGVLLICAGGGGIPATIDGAGEMRAVEAVVDKDLTASLLARRLEADALVMLTDVDAVHLDWGQPDETVLREATPAELRRHSFEPESMARKIEAACRFVETTGRRAAIGELRDALAIARGEAGTQIAAPRA